MGSVDTQLAPTVFAEPDAAPLCRYGHCRAVIAVPDGQRRVRCRDCGWPNTVPGRVHVTCERCNHSQRFRFSQRNSQPLCASCGCALRIREIELSPARRRHRRWSYGRRRVSGRESNALTILLYAILLLVFLLWLSGR